MLLHPLWQCWEWKQFWWICVEQWKHSVCLCWFRPVVNLENQVCRCKLHAATVSWPNVHIEWLTSCGIMWDPHQPSFPICNDLEIVAVHVCIYVYSVLQILVLVLYQLAFGITLLSISFASFFQITASLFKLLQLHFALICLCVITFVTWRLLLVCSSFLILSLRIMLYVV